MEAADLELRRQVYRLFVELGRAPTREELGGGDADDGLRRLHDAHALVLHPGTTEIRMANPFSAVPNLELDRLAAVRTHGLDTAVGVQGSRDPERVPGAVGVPAPALALDPVRRRDGRKRVRHPDLGRARVEDERMCVVEAPQPVVDIIAA